MTNKQILASIYLNLRKQFDGNNFIGKYPTIEELCKKFKMIDLKDKIEAVNFAIISKNKNI